MRLRGLTGAQLQNYTAMLYIFVGLPGTGKSTLASGFARERKAVYLRIDRIEQVLRDSRTSLDGPEGYSVACRVAADNFRLGLDVVADSVNPLEITRDAWRHVAEGAGVPFVELKWCAPMRLNTDPESKHPSPIYPG